MRWARRGLAVIRHPSPQRHVRAPSECWAPRLPSMPTQLRQRPGKHCTLSTDTEPYKIVNVANERWAARRSFCCRLVDAAGIGPLPPKPPPSKMWPRACHHRSQATGGPSWNPAHPCCRHARRVIRSHTLHRSACDSCLLGERPGSLSGVLALSGAAGRAHAGGDHGAKLPIHADENWVSLAFV